MRRVRFAGDTIIPISAETSTTGLGVYKPRRRHAAARFGNAEDNARHLRCAQENARRCAQNDSAEAAMLLLHKLRVHTRPVWNATGAAAASEDALRPFLDWLSAPPPDDACGTLSLDAVQRALLGPAPRHPST
jgi:hypothetical protein